MLVNFFRRIAKLKEDLKSERSARKKAETRSEELRTYIADGERADVRASMGNKEARGKGSPHGGLNVPSYVVGRDQFAITHCPSPVVPSASQPIGSPHK